MKQDSVGPPQPTHPQFPATAWWGSTAASYDHTGTQTQISLLSCQLHLLNMVLELNRPDWRWIMEPNEEKLWNDMNPLCLLSSMSSFRDADGRLDDPVCRAQSEKHLCSLASRASAVYAATDRESCRHQMFAVFTRRPTNESETVLKCLCCFTVQCCVFTVFTWSLVFCLQLQTNRKWMLRIKELCVLKSCCFHLSFRIIWNILLTYRNTKFEKSLTFLQLLTARCFSWQIPSTANSFMPTSGCQVMKRWETA